MVINIVKLKRLALGAWALFTLALTVGWYVEHQSHALLKENMALAKRALVAQDELGNHIRHVNNVCIGQWVETMQRLGLDDEMMPLVTTALWKYATGNFRVSEARKLFKAKPQANGYLTKRGLVDMDTAALGGPESDEDLPPISAPSPTPPKTSRR